MQKKRQPRKSQRSDLKVGEGGEEAKLTAAALQINKFHLRDLCEVLNINFVFLGVFFVCSSSSLIIFSLTKFNGGGGHSSNRNRPPEEEIVGTD